MNIDCPVLNSQTHQFLQCGRWSLELLVAVILQAAFLRLQFVAGAQYRYWILNSTKFPSNEPTILTSITGTKKRSGSPRIPFETIGSESKRWPTHAASRFVYEQALVKAISMSTTATEPGNYSSKFRLHTPITAQNQAVMNYKPFNFCSL